MGGSIRKIMPLGPGAAPTAPGRFTSRIFTALAHEAPRFVGWHQPTSADDNGFDFAVAHQFVELGTAEPEASAERFDAISEKWRVRNNVHANLGSSWPVEPGRERIRANADASSLLA